MKSRISTLAAGSLFAAAMFVGTAARADLVLNGGFETGDFTGWTTFGDSSFSGVDSFVPLSGTYAAYFGSPVGGGISQSLATTAGGSYMVEFWLQNEADVTGVSSSNSFEFDWDGAAVLSVADAAPFGYTHYSFLLTASSGSTDLRFAFSQTPAFWDMDDVSVTAHVPEPSSLALLGLSGGLLVLQARRRRKAAVGA